MPAQHLQPLPDRGPPALWRFRVLAEAEHVAAGIEQGLDLERELRWIAHELPQLDGGGDQLLEPCQPAAKGALDWLMEGPLRKPYSWKMVTQKSPPCSPVSVL